MTIVPPALGRRGEGWVVLQSAVIIAVAACAILGPRWPQAVEPWFRIAGIALEVVAVAMFAVSRVTLGTSFTVLPRPHDRSTLRDTGIYSRVRHPVYGALLIGGVGLSLHRSPLVFVPTALLAVVFFLKSLREEAWLTERYPDYPAYRQSTPHRFIPWFSEAAAESLSRRRHHRRPRRVGAFGQTVASSRTWVSRRWLPDGSRKPASIP